MDEGIYCIAVEAIVKRGVVENRAKRRGITLSQLTLLVKIQQGAPTTMTKKNNKQIAV